MTSTSSGSEKEPAAAKKNSAGRGRRIGVVLLILMASVLLFGTAADVWVKRQVLSTPKWVAASDKILADPKVQAALATGQDVAHDPTLGLKPGGDVGGGRGVQRHPLGQGDLVNAGLVLQ